MASQRLNRNLKSATQSLRRMDIDYDVVQRDDGTPFITVPYNVVTRDRTEPVDVNIDSQQDRVHGNRYLTVTSLVIEGQTGENETVFHRVLDRFNYESEGKYVPDVNDGSQDILYTKNVDTENVPKKVHGTVLRNTVQHVARTVAQVRPELKQLSRDLNLQPVLKPSQEDRFAAQWFNTRQGIRELRAPDEVSFLQPGKEHKRE